jgi:hypothetical protein
MGDRPQAPVPARSHRPAIDAFDQIGEGPRDRGFGDGVKLLFARVIRVAQAPQAVTHQHHPLSVTKLLWKPVQLANSAQGRT